MKIKSVLSITAVYSCLIMGPAWAQDRPIEISDDGHEIAIMKETGIKGRVAINRSGVPYGTVPDWENNLRRQVGGLQAKDMNGDGLIDVVVGCYKSNSYPPYPEWKNLIYYNTGHGLETNPSWISTDEVSTGDIQVGLINNDPYPDVFSANGGSAMSPSVIYWGSATGPSTAPGWWSAEPGYAWNNYALLFDFDHDGDLDLITANQGNSSADPYRPIFGFTNNNGTLLNYPHWQSAETSIQGFLAFADYNGDGWEDLAVSKWVNFESGIYHNMNGALQTVPGWTTGDTDSDKGVAWSDVDGNSWPDLVLGHDPTLLYGNTGGALTPAWSSTASYHGHSDIRFCDVDRDGDEDLAEIHFSDGKVHIYLNQGGVLDSAPSWTYDSSYAGTALAFGDINGDLWPDLIMGTSGDDSVSVFYAKALDADVDQVSASTGGVVNFTLNATAVNGGRNYFLLGSASGIEPGLPLPGSMVTLPLNWDLVTDIIISLANSAVLPNFHGLVDTQGLSAAQLNTNGPMPPSAVGATLYFSFLLYYPVIYFPYDFVSNPVAIEITP